MKMIAKLALSAPLLLVLSACGETEDPAAVDAEAGLPVEETMPMDTTVPADDAMATDPMAEDPMAADPMAEDPMAEETMTPEDDATPTADPAVPE